MNERLKHQHDIFHYAAKISNIEILKKATKADLNKRDEDGRTPTHWVAFKGNIKSLALIVSRGGNPKKCDYFGNSALHYAVRGGSIMCVTYLINFCPELVFILDNNYKIAQDVASIHNHKQIYDLLENAYNTLLQTKDFNLRKMFRRTVKDVKFRREKFARLCQKKFQETINEIDISIKNIEEACLVNNKEENCSKTKTKTKQKSTK